MSVTEKSLQEAIQDTLQALTEFKENSVTINDWSKLDGSTKEGPYAIVVNSDTFRNNATYDTKSYWEIKVELWLPFDTKWIDSLDEFRDMREAVLGGFVGAARTGSMDSVDIKEIRNDGPITYLGAEDAPDAIPSYIFQSVVFVCEEF